MKRTKMKVGDIFVVELDKNSKRYFQYVANDLTQLNSNVIRAFKKNFQLDYSPNISEIVNDDIDFYAHCLLDIGVKLGFWEIIGNNSNVGTHDIYFRGTIDYGKKVGEEPVKESSNWYVWKINEKMKHVGKLEGEYKEAYAGIVINPKGILEMLKGNKYPPNYPD